MLQCLGRMRNDLLRRIRLLAGNGLAPGHAAQPGELALGQLTRGSYRLVAPDGDWFALVHAFPGLAVADAADRGQGDIQITALA